MADKARKIIVYTLSLTMITTGLLRLFAPSTSSCANDKKQQEETTQEQVEIVADDAFVVSEQDQILHKGSIIKTKVNGYVLKLNCGEVLFTNDFSAFTNEPSQEKFEHKCNKCFYEEKERTV